MRDMFTNTYLIILLYLDTLSSNMTSCAESTTISSELDIKGSQVHYNKLIQLFITHIQCTREKHGRYGDNSPHKSKDCSK